MGKESKSRKKKSSGEKKKSKSSRSSKDDKQLHKGDVEVSNVLPAIPSEFNPNNIKSWTPRFCRLSKTSVSFFVTRKDKKEDSVFQLQDRSAFENMELEGSPCIILFSTTDERDDDHDCIVLKLNSDTQPGWSSILDILLPEVSGGMTQIRKVSNRMQDSQNQISDLNGFLSNLRLRPVSSQIDNHDIQLGMNWAHLDDNAKTLVLNALGGKDPSGRVEVLTAQDTFNEFAQNGRVDEAGVRQILNRYELNAGDEEVKAIMKGASRNPKKHIKFEDFIASFAGFTMFERVRRLFDQFDEDHSDSIDRKELLSLMRHLNLNPTKQDVDDLLKKYDIDKNETLCFTEFLDLYCEYALEHKSLDTDGLRKMFKAFDLDGDGTVDISEVKKLLMTVGESLSENEVMAAFHSGKLESDGQMNFSEFCRFIHGLNRENMSQTVMKPLPVLSEE